MPIEQLLSSFFFLLSFCSNVFFFLSFLVFFFMSKEERGGNFSIKNENQKQTYCLRPRRLERFQLSKLISVRLIKALRRNLYFIWNLTSQLFLVSALFHGHYLSLFYAIAIIVAFANSRSHLSHRHHRSSKQLYSFKPGWQQNKKNFFICDLH